MTTYTGTPAKLRSGEWGCRGNTEGNTLRKGSTITVEVTTRSGKAWTRDYNVIWCDEHGKFLAAPESSFERIGFYRPNDGYRTHHDRMHEEAVDMGRACPVCHSYN